MSVPAAALLAALALGAAAGRAAAGDEPPSPALPGPALTVGEDRSGGEIALPAGAHLAVELESASGGGYVWSVTRCDAALLELIAEETIPAGDPRVLGGPARQRFLFRALAPGSAELALALARPWKPGEPLRIFSVRVVAAAH